jgi:hypothetical protein
LASLTILYSLWEKKNETTKQEIEKEMAMPLNILDEIGRTYGPTRKLYQALANLVAATIDNLERSRAGAKVQATSRGSQTPTLIPPPMQLPVRIDASLRFERGGFETSVQSPNLNPSSKNFPPKRSDTQSIAPLPRPNHGNSQNPTQGDTEMSPPTAALNDVPNTDGAGVSPSGVFDDSMLWAPSFKWTGGWDDFLNAIAM